MPISEYNEMLLFSDDIVVTNKTLQNRIPWKRKMTIIWDVASPVAHEYDPRAEAGINALESVRSIDWSNMTHDEVNALGRSVNLLADDPRHLWRIFRFYTRMLHAGKAYEAVGLMREGNVRLRLRDSWLDVNCTDLNEPDVYRSITGEDGYATYMEYSETLKGVLDKVGYYGFVVAGRVPETSRHHALVNALFEEYVPGANW